uniref:Large ribosomal subunit protein uL24c n=1 Tax=Bicosoecida sp. CB-2014 TaxID=1486930 RepID=A0A7S1C4Y4_9STRA|mmetsp:Transcript_11212/g.39021  ORF Transcript_11212/g.39021 Transcript_11212/m.39021 type:complete len:175 (+) Transcript_11212:187-711(+)
MALREVRRWAMEGGIRQAKRMPPAPLGKWRIVRGDTVEVVSGRDRGKQGVVKRVLRKQNRIVVEGVNMVRKHVRADGQNAGGIFSVEAALHVSNVNLVDPVSGKPTRVAIREMEDGSRVRVAKRSGAIIPRPELLKARTTPRRASVGPKDTEAAEAHRRTFADEDLLEALRGGA